MQSERICIVIWRRNYNVFKFHNKLHRTRMMTWQLLIWVDTLAAQGSRMKQKVYIHFTQMNLFSKCSYCNGNILPHNWNLWFFYVIIIVQCKVFLFLFHIIFSSSGPKDPMSLCHGVASVVRPSVRPQFSKCFFFVISQPILILIVS